MYGTMQDFPLTITAIMRHGCGVHGRRTVTTAVRAIGTVAIAMWGNELASWQMRCAASVLPGTSGLPRSCGTTPNTW